MTVKEIKEQLKAGQQFGIDSANWYTINRPQEGLRMIVNNGANNFYKDMNSYAKRVYQLINRGY